MNHSSRKTPTPIKLALNAAGLGWFEYNHNTKEIDFNDQIRSWLKIENSAPLDIQQFAKSLKDEISFLNSVDYAFANEPQPLRIEIESRLAISQVLEMHGQISNDILLTGIIKPISLLNSNSLPLDEENEIESSIESFTDREHELNSVIQSAPFPIGVYIGEELRIKIANKAMIEAWGKGDDVLGKLYTEVLPELENQEIFDQLKEVLRTGTASHFKNIKIYLLINQKLKSHYFNYSFTPIFDAKGNVYGVMNTAADVTDLNIAKIKIQQNEQRFINLMENAPVAIAVFSGRELVIETHNSAFAEIVGKVNDFSGKRLCEVMPELVSENQPFLNILDEVYQTGIPYERFGTQVKILKDGVMTNNYYNFTYTPMFDETDSVYAILEIAIDVTENVLAQNKVLESEKSLRNTILKAPVAMCILKKPNFIVEIANNRMLDLWHVSTDIIGRPLSEYLPEAKEQGFEKLLLTVIHDGKTINAYETPFNTIRNGVSTSIFVDFVYEPYRDNNEEITGVIVVAHDVTQQVMARRKIEDAEAKARLAIDAADLGVYELRYDGSYMDYSQRFMDIWGITQLHSRDQLTSKLHRDDIKVRELAHSKSFETGNLNYEARIYKDDGSHVWFRATGKVLKDNHGNQETLIGVIQDITEQKQFAEELTRLVFQRTMELQRSNEDLQQFAHVASHDLKEPVRKIKFYNNMLQDQFADLLPPKAISHLEKIHNATDRMFNMIDGVLKYSSIRGTSKDIEDIDLNSIFNNLESDLEVLIRQKNATIVRGELPQIQGAPVLIHQLFYNIVNNALKFSSTDVKTVITVACELLMRYGTEMAKITISDNGIGLDQNYISKIFNPFIRLNPKDKYEGTGLGLALCKKITEQHYGIIEADGNSGGGATFTVVLPVKQDGELYVPPIY